MCVHESPFLPISHLDLSLLHCSGFQWTIQHWPEVWGSLLEHGTCLLFHQSLNPIKSTNNGQNISYRSEHQTCHSHRSNAHSDKYLSLNSFQTQSSQKCQHIIHSATISKIQQTNIEKVSQIRFFGGEGKHNDHGLTCDLWGCFVDQSRSIFRQ